MPSYWFGDCCSKKKEIYQPNNKLANEINNQDNQENQDNTVHAMIDNEKKEDNLDKISNQSSNSSIFDDNPHKNEIDFQNEDIYRDKSRKNDVFLLRNITKVYSDGKMAVNDVSFNLFRNEIFALLGRNGAGKTSLINVLIGMFETTSGSALYKEKNILEEKNMEEFRNKLGICPQHDILFPKLTVREHLEMFCYFKSFPVDKIKEEVDNTLQDFRIHDIENVLEEN